LAIFYKIYDVWSFERVLRHVIYWMAWLVFFAVTYANIEGESIFRWASLEFYFLLPKLFVTYCTIYWLIPKFFLKKDKTRFSLYFILTVLIGGFVMWLIEVPYCYDSSFLENVFSIKIFLKFKDLIYVAAIPIAIKLAQENFKQQQLAEKIKQQSLQSELLLLKNQLHPHFLFNTLNNLYSLTLYNDKAASKVVLRLSELLSYMLYECNSEYIKLGKEIEHLNNYIELEKIRFNDRIKVETVINGDFDHKNIAPLLLLPFIENAFKHGVSSHTEKAWIKILLKKDNEQLIYKVENSLPNKSLEKDKRHSISHGIGLKNIKKRLQVLYPDHKLEISENGTYKATLQIPLK